MQSRGDIYPVGVGDAGERHRQAPGESLLGAIVGVLAPGDVAEPADGPMKPPRRLREIGEQRRRPFLQSTALEAEAALAPADLHTGCNQWIRHSFSGRNKTVRVAFAQSEGGEGNPLRTGEAD